MQLHRLLPALLCCSVAIAAEVTPAPPTPGPPGVSPPPTNPDPSTRPRATPPVSPVAPQPGAAAGSHPVVPPSEGRVTNLDDIHAVNTVDPVNGRPVDGMKWVYAVHAGQVTSGSVQGMTYIAFASEASLAEFERADPETKRKYIDIARGAQREVDPRTHGEPATPAPLTSAP
jgi:hypothetical protein